ncbi:MAG: SDR family NAD(P)-dependent oxidoreductase, partial [Ferrovibrio sp.]
MMSIQRHSFDDIHVGDHICFDRTFTEQDFAAFSLLSGDRNLLHHDSRYAAERGFRGPIVPLHLALAPLSAIAGMNLPGEPSLYLSHHAHAILPIFYNETITYSARVRSISAPKQTLDLTVIGIRGDEVVLEAEMAVQVRDSTWETAATHPIRRADRARRAVITGASGAIAVSVARLLLQRGWNLILQTRPAHSDSLRDTFGNSAHVRVVSADLSSDSDRHRLMEIVGASGVDCIVHTASPPVDAALGTHVAVTHKTLAELSMTALPNMLRQQDGAIVFIGSAAVEAAPRGWDD